MTVDDNGEWPLAAALQQVADAPTMAIALERLAAALADERVRARQRLRALGVAEAEIDAVLVHGERMHAAQVAWYESVVSQRAGLATLQ